MRYCLEAGFLERRHILLSWWPCRQLPEDTFRQAVARISAALAEIESESECRLWQQYVQKFAKGLFNKAIGFMVSSDEPIVFDYSCSTDPTERPACAVALPLMERGESAPLHQWAVPTEQRSLDTLRPIHNQILQVARLRVCQVARYLRLSLGLQGWLPKYVC